jgi:hypothetical protein
MEWVIPTGGFSYTVGWAPSLRLTYLALSLASRVLMQPCAPEELLNQLP